LANYVEEFVAFLGWKVDDKELEKFEKQVDDLGGMLKHATAIVAGAATGLTALTAVVNQTTAANVALAKSVGVSSEFLGALSGVVAPLGFEFDNVVDLVEEMNNKMGESVGLGKPVSGVADSVKILGLEFKKLKDLAPEEQFIEILSAAKDLKNEQAAVSAVDMLMGGEANKILGFLRTQDESLLDLIKRQLQLNLLTEKGRQGAERFNKTFSELKTVANSAKQEFFGLIGEALSPLLETYADWIAANNDIIKAEIAKWADDIGRALAWLISSFGWFIGKVKDVVNALGGMGNVLKLTAVAFGAMFGAKAIMAVQTFIKMIRVAGTEALLFNIKAALIPVTIAAVIALFALLGEDLYQFFTGGESALGKIGAKISEFVYDNVRPIIASMLGMTPEELDQAFLSVIDSIAWFFGKLVDWTARGIEGVVEYSKGFFTIMKELGKQIGYFVEGTLMPIASSVFTFFKSLLGQFVGFVTSIPGMVYKTIKNSIASVSGLLSSLPLVGDTFKGIEGALSASQSGLSTLSTAPSALASTGARTAVTNANQSRTVNQSTQVRNEFVINQNPGESGESLASRVADEIQRASARAISANDSGIEI